MRLRLSQEMRVGVAELLGESPVNQIVLASVAAGTNDDGVVWSSAQDLSERARVPKQEVMRVFQRLQKLKVGEFKVGRRGFPSRFVWTVQPADVAAMALAAAGPAIPRPAKGMTDVQLSSGRAISVPKNPTKDELREIFDWVGQQMLR